MEAQRGKFENELVVGMLGLSQSGSKPLSENLTRRDRQLPKGSCADNVRESKPPHMDRVAQFSIYRACGVGEATRRQRPGHHLQTVDGVRKLTSMAKPEHKSAGTSAVCNIFIPSPACYAEAMASHLQVGEDVDIWATIVPDVRPDAVQRKRWTYAERKNRARTGLDAFRTANRYCSNDYSALTGKRLEVRIKQGDITEWFGPGATGEGTSHKARTPFHLSRAREGTADCTNGELGADIELICTWPA